jgi:hypothetical protein
MTAAMARVRATYSNAGDHRETRRTPRSPWSRSSQAANHMSDVALCGAISRYNEAVLPPGPSNHFNLTPKRARMEGFNILDYVPRFPDPFEALGRWQSEGKLVQRRMWLSVYASPSKSGIWKRLCCRGDGKTLARLIAQEFLPISGLERLVPNNVYKVRTIH